jgi:hypothetical protein
MAEPSGIRAPPRAGKISQRVACNALRVSLRNSPDMAAAWRIDTLIRRLLPVRRLRAQALHRLRLAGNADVGAGDNSAGRRHSGRSTPRSPEFPTAWRRRAVLAAVPARPAPAPPARRRQPPQPRSRPLSGSRSCAPMRAKMNCLAWPLIRSPRNDGRLAPEKHNVCPRPEVRSPVCSTSPNCGERPDRRKREVWGSSKAKRARRSRHPRGHGANAPLPSVRLRTSAHPIERTTPPSTRSAAPVVAEAWGEQT